MKSLKKLSKQYYQTQIKIEEKKTKIESLKKFVDGTNKETILKAIKQLENEMKEDLTFTEKTEKYIKDGSFFVLECVKTLTKNYEKEDKTKKNNKNNNNSNNDNNNKNLKKNKLEDSDNNEISSKKQKKN
jgi:hypothetical protein